MRLLWRDVLFTVLVPGTVAGIVPWLIAGTTAAPSQASVLWGLPWFVLGGGVYGWCVWEFARSGRGTPAPLDPPRRLVVSGLYRYCRNPMYLGVLMVLLGWSIWSASLWVAAYGVAVAVMFHLFVVGYEEPHLRRRFGPEYTAYCAHVRRWLPGGRWPG